LIVSNTTIQRPPGLREAAIAKEIGGLSGKPLFELSTRMLAQTFLRVERRVPLVGVGGIDSAEAAWTKIRAGASLLQLYTALIYKGPALLADIRQGLLKRLEGSPLPSAVGGDATELAKQPG